MADSTLFSMESNLVEERDVSPRLLAGCQLAVLPNASVAPGALLQPPSLGLS